MAIEKWHIKCRDPIQAPRQARLARASHSDHLPAVTLGAHAGTWSKQRDTPFPSIRVSHQFFVTSSGNHKPALVEAECNLGKWEDSDGLR